MSNVWSQIEAILSTKADVFDDEYHPWVVNVALSHHPDTVLAANVMNQYYGLPKRSQYDFLMGAVRKAKRPRTQWHKGKKDEDVELVSQAYNINKTRAQEYLRLLTEDQVQAIRDSLSEGGKTR